ncbi:phospholipase D-like domain-containing protein [Streptomyces sp. NPDC020801]|uniref:phospholipase D-like domain-containing protein n=1 Tax=unclassified Streptomyces TaxID=2593676 RepID=UPI003795D91B
MLWKVLGRAGVALAAGAAVFATAVPANAASYSAFAFSQSGSRPTIYDFINSATASLDTTMYELEDTTAVNDLIALKNKGVTVRVVLNAAASASFDRMSLTARSSTGRGEPRPRCPSAGRRRSKAPPRSSLAPRGIRRRAAGPPTPGPSPAAPPGFPAPGTSAWAGPAYGPGPARCGCI